MTDSISWTDLFVMGLGGGAIHTIAKGLVETALPAGTATVAGMSIADVLLVIGGKYGADRTKGYISSALSGTAVIGVYKIAYQTLIEPFLTKMGWTAKSPLQPPKQKREIPLQMQTMSAENYYARLR